MCVTLNKARLLGRISMAVPPDIGVSEGDHQADLCSGGNRVELKPAHSLDHLGSSVAGHMWVSCSRNISASVEWINQWNSCFLLPGSFMPPVLRVNILHPTITAEWGRWRQEEM